jgi:hypothetical protein
MFKYSFFNTGYWDTSLPVKQFSIIKLQTKYGET